MFFLCKFYQITSELNPPRIITEKSSHSEPVSNKIHNETEAETIKQEMDKQSRKKTLQPSQSLPGMDNMENTRRKTPNLVETRKNVSRRPQQQSPPHQPQPWMKWKEREIQYQLQLKLKKTTSNRP